MKEISRLQIVDNQSGKLRGMRWVVDGEEMWFLPESLADADLTDIDNAFTANGNVCVARHKERFNSTPKYVPDDDFDLTEFCDKQKRRSELPQGENVALIGRETEEKKMSNNVFRFVWRAWFFMGLGGSLCSLFFALIDIPFTAPLLAYFIFSWAGVVFGTSRITRGENPLHFLPRI